MNINNYTLLFCTVIYTQTYYIKLSKKTQINHDQAARLKYYVLLCASSLCLKVVKVQRPAYDELKCKNRNLDDIHLLFNIYYLYVGKSNLFNVKLCRTFIIYLLVFL